MSLAQEKFIMPSKPRILIVDDEERFRKTMCKLLTAEGYESSTAANGQEALDHLEKGSYDIIILDIRMPEMNGVQVLSEIKKIDAALEIIIMTGYASVDTAKEIMTLGAYDYLLKPYDINELLEKIDAAYDRKVTRQQLT
jgi:DNA-binding NtrC family response regulator